MNTNSRGNLLRITLPGKYPHPNIRVENMVGIALDEYDRVKINDKISWPMSCTYVHVTRDAERASSLR